MSQKHEQPTLTRQPRRLRLALALIGWMLAALVGGQTATAQDYSTVPGFVIDHSPASSGRYIGSPSIVILPNGDYVASHDDFGGASNKSTTFVFRSTDQGQTWTPSATVNNQYWSNLFTQGNDLYLLGTTAEYGKVAIRKSTDGGLSWSTATSASNGLLKSANGYHTAPMPVVEHNGRIWRAMEDTFNGGGWPKQFRSFAMSAPVGSDLLNAANWTFTNSLPSDTEWLNGEVNGWLEGGVVVNRDNQLETMLRVDNLPVAARVKINEANNTVSFDPDTGFVDFPGGAKKFSVRYDAQSDKYWTLSNPVLPQHQGSSPGSTRNALALMSSSDLSDWEVQSVVLYHPDVDKHAFQYVDWQFDGNDLAAASRTAYDDGQGGAHRGHDANFLTFHRIEDFRTLSPSHALVADTSNNQILRYQANTSGAWVPLGKFTTSNLPGAPLNSPMGLVQDAKGFVYVGEEKDGGRILRFDAGGNFIDVVATEGADFQGRPEALALAADGKLLLSTAFGGDSDRILQIDPTDGVVQTLVDRTFAGGSLDNPRGIAVDGDGTLYVANREGDDVLKFDAATGAYLGNLWSVDRPQGLAWDDANSRLVASALSSTDLYAVDPSGAANKLYDPNDIGPALGVQTIDGQVFWTDYTAGKVYRLTGANQKETVASGLSGPGHLIGVDKPQERTWISNSAGVWRDPTNWQSYWGVANSATEIAVFGPGLTAARTVILDESETVGGVRFLGNHDVAIAGPGRLTLAGGPLQVFAGDHQFQVEVQLDAKVTADIAAGASLALNNRLLLAGNDFHKTGLGELTLSGEIIADGGSVILDEGTINGSGSLLGSLVNVGGTVSPGNSPGLLTIAGDYSQSEQGELVIELAGADASRYDQLAVQGEFNAAGRLRVDLLDGFTPAAGNSFDIVTYGASNSQFSDLVLPQLQQDLAWQVSHSSRAGTLQLSVVSVPEPEACLMVATLVSISLQLRCVRL